MKQWLFTLASAVIAALLSTTPAVAQRDDTPRPGLAPDPKIEVVEVQVRKKVPKEMSFDNYAMNGFLRLRLALVAPQRFIMEIDPSASKLTSCTDDKGTDLTRSTQQYPPKWMDEYSAIYNKERTIAEVGLYFPGTPAKGATKVHLKGKLVLVVGIEEKIKEGKDLSLTEAGVNLGSFQIKRPKGINDYNKRSPVDVISPKNDIKEVKFYDTRGNALKGFAGGNFSTGGFGTPKMWQRNYDVENLPANFNVEIIYFARTEPIDVPLNLETGLAP